MTVHWVSSAGSYAGGRRWVSVLIQRSGIRHSTPVTTITCTRFRSISGLQMLERAAQLVARPMDVGLHRAERQVERGGDLLVRPPLDMTQHDARTILRPESRDRALD